MAAFLLSVLVVISSGSSDIFVYLNGDDWMLTNSSMTKPIPATVPGEVYYPLISANILNDPWYGNEPTTDNWVAMVNWTYFKTFTIDKNSLFLESRVIQLIADGIDTLATVYINNNLIFTNDNMFHRNWINIPSKYLNYGSNSIFVNFTNKPQWAQNEYASCNNVTDGYCPAGGNNGFPDFNYIRTEPCSFGWNWGAAYSPVGIWKGIYLQSYNDAVIRDFMIIAVPHSNISYSSWNTKVVVYVDAGSTNTLLNSSSNKLGTVAGTIRVEITNISKVVTMDVQVTENTETNFTVQLGVLDNIHIWMPNEFGNQPLYEFTVNFVGKNTTDKGKTHNFGFRQVELIQDPLPGGTSFYFRVNGINIPVHGSNWIPSNSLDNSNYSVNRDTLMPYFVALKNSHQNMIRNWGGGIYQQESFYSLADEFGIMIWEDMMFACAQYWLNPNWLKSVSKEVIDTVRNIQHHSSIAIWSANNENGQFCTVGTETEVAYRTLYWTNVLDHIIVLDAGTRPYVSSSPSNGYENETNPCSGNPFDWDHGDDHQYLLAGQDCWEVSQYYPARFVSEFGWESWPTYPTMTQFLSEDEWSFMSTQMQSRQKLKNGQESMIKEIGLHYNLPNVSNSNEQFMYMLYATNYMQAYCTKVQVEYYRTLRYSCTNNNGHTKHGCTMGEMYWQTNDFWPGSSWSSIDILNRYKMEQYFANRFYAKIIVAGYNLNNQWQFWAVNDYVNWSDANCILQFNSYSYVNGKRNEWNITAINVTTESAEMVYKIYNNTQFLATSKCVSLSDCILTWNLIDSTNTIKTSNWMFVGSPNNTKANDPQLKILYVTQMNNNMEFMITFNCKSIAVFGWLETVIYGHFNDNGMLLFPGNHSVIFYASEKTNATILQQSMNIYSLYEAGGFANVPTQMT